MQKWIRFKNWEVFQGDDNNKRCWILLARVWGV
jgi:hypothetical protein